MSEGAPFQTSFEVKFKPDGVFLFVSKSNDSSPVAEENLVLDELRRLRVHGFNAAAVHDAVVKADSIDVKIAEPQMLEKVNAQVDASASPDKMKAFISLRAAIGGGNGPAAAQILEALREKGITYGIDKTAILDLVLNPVYGQNILVAQGTPALNGKNGTITWMVDLSREKKPTIKEDGSVDYKEMDLVESVIKGQQLARVNPPVQGLMGHLVTGAEIKPIDGKPAVLPKGRNVIVSTDGQYLLSDINGQILFADGKISVFATFEVKADVDNSTGNINVVGNVAVRGSVLAGFSIEAGGNVEVEGVVEGANIRAGGNIILKRGMIGNGKGTLIAGNDVIAKYIENSVIEAKGDIRSESIMHSDVKCGGKLELGGKKGLLVGGIVRVGKEIEAKVIGSPMSTITNIEVGVDPLLREKLKSLRSEIPILEENLIKTNQAIALLKKLDNTVGLSDERREMLAKSTRAKFVYEGKLVEGRKELISIEAKLQHEAAGKVHISGSAYHGVRVSIGSCSMYVKETIQYCTLYRDGADIRVGALQK